MEDKVSRVALRVCIDKDEDIEALNNYLRCGYKIVDRTEVAQRIVDPIGKNVFFASVIYILER